MFGKYTFAIGLAFTILIVAFFFIYMVPWAKSQDSPQITSIPTESPLKGDFAFTEGDIKALIRQESQEFDVSEAIMLKLADCESDFRQFDRNGDILRGLVHSSDIGVFQINIDPKDTDWEFVARMTGYDPYTVEGNIKLAMLIASEYGYQHWVCNDIINNSSPSLPG